MDYQEFLKQKIIINHSYGHECHADLSAAFHYQKAAIDWATQKGRCALFEDTGLGKTYQQIMWADSVVKETQGKVLILAPLSVSAQTVNEGLYIGTERFAMGAFASFWHKCACHRFLFINDPCHIVRKGVLGSIPFLECFEFIPELRTLCGYK